MKSILPTIATALLASVLALQAQKETPLVTQNEDHWLAVLQSNAGPKEKADACRELAVIGTSKSVPVLAGLLADPAMNHFARHAMETLKDPSVDDALRQALGKLKGRPLVGVIGSIGVRRDARATTALAALLRDQDAEVSGAAARSLGSIGTLEAARALQAALPGSPATRLDLCEGLLRCAEALASSNDRKAARAIYEQLTDAKDIQQVKAAAARGAVLVSGGEALDLISRQLLSQDYIVFAATVRACMELENPEVTRAMAGAFTKVSPDQQVVLLESLGLRRDDAALATITAAARDGAKAVRLAALKALPMTGRAEAAPTLVRFLADPDKEFAQAAQASLAALPGEAVDRAVLALLANTDPGLRVTALDLMARRRMTANLSEVVKATSDPDSRVRSAAMRRMGELAGPSDLPLLTGLIMKAETSQELDAAEQAVSAACAKADNQDAVARQVAALLPQAKPARKAALLRVLASIGNKLALDAVRAAVRDTDASVRDTAIRCLGDWKTADAAPDLLALARSSTDATEKKLCLRSYLGLARNTDLPADQRLAMCREAVSLVQAADEKRMLLAALGGIQTAASVQLIAPHLASADTREEAATAIVTIAERLVRSQRNADQAARLVEPLEAVVKQTQNPELARRASEALKQARARAAGAAR